MVLVGGLLPPLEGVAGLVAIALAVGFVVGLVSMVEILARRLPPSPGRDVGAALLAGITALVGMTFCVGEGAYLSSMAFHPTPRAGLAGVSSFLHSLKATDVLLAGLLGVPYVPLIYCRLRGDTTERAAMISFAVVLVATTAVVWSAIDHGSDGKREMLLGALALILAAAIPSAYEFAHELEKTWQDGGVEPPAPP